MAMDLDRRCMKNIDDITNAQHSMKKTLPLRAISCLPFKVVPELIKNGYFQHKYFVTLSLLTKTYVSITKTAAPY